MKSSNIIESDVGVKSKLIHIILIKAYFKINWQIKFFIEKEN